MIGCGGDLRHVALVGCRAVVLEVALPYEAGGAVGPEQLELVLVVAAAVLVAEDPNEVVPDFVVARRVARPAGWPLAPGLAAGAP